MRSAGEAVERERLAGVVGNLTADGDIGKVGLNVFTGRGKSGLGNIDRLVDDSSLLAKALSSIPVLVAVPAPSSMRVRVQTVFCPRLVAESRQHGR